MKKLFTIGIISLAFTGLLAGTASAAGVQLKPELYPPGAATLYGESEITDPGGGDYLRDARILIAHRIINTILAIAGVLAIYFIINNAFYLIFAAGSEEGITQRKKAFTWALVGLLLIILSYSIVRFVVEFAFQVDQEAPAAAGTPAASGTPAATTGGGESSASPDAPAMGDYVEGSSDEVPA